MTNCTCSNCTFTGNGKRYCYDCKKYTDMPSKVELEREIKERFEKAKGEL